MSILGGEEMELGKQIKKHRQEVQLSQEKLADRVYVSRQTISNWENDKSYPDVNSLVLLSEIFQISLDNLIKGDIEVMKDVIQKEEKRGKERHQNARCCSTTDKALQGIQALPSVPNLIYCSLKVPISGCGTYHNRHVHNRGLQIQSPQVRTLPIAKIQKSVVPYSFLPVLNLVSH